MKVLVHLSSYEELKETSKKIKQYADVVEAVTDVQPTGPDGPDGSGADASATLDPECLQLWRFLSEDSFDIDPPATHSALREYPSLNRDSSIASARQPPDSAGAIAGAGAGAGARSGGVRSGGGGGDGGSVFDLPAEEVVLAEARPAQVAAFRALVAHFKDVNCGAQPRPPHGELRAALQREWAALRDLLRVFGAAVRSTYFGVGLGRRERVGARVHLHC